MHDEDICRLNDWKIIYTLHGKRESRIVKAANMGIALLRLSESLGDFSGILYLNHIYECGGNSDFLPTYSEDGFCGAKAMRATDFVGRMDKFFENDDPPKWTLQDIATMTWRDLIRTWRQPEMLTFAVIMGVFFLLLFYYVFGGAIGAGTGVDYIQYLVPGIFVITTLTGAQQTGTGLATDLSQGVTDRFRSLPMSQMAVLGGRTIADALRNTISVVLVAIVGYMLGFRFVSIGAAIGAIVLSVGIGFSFSWMNAAIAAKVKSAGMVGMLSMFWLFPLMLASTVFTPAEQMPGWLQGFAKWQPISVVADAARKLSDGIPAGEAVLWSIVWILALLVVFVPIAAAVYRRG